MNISENSSCWVIIAEDIATRSVIHHGPPEGTTECVQPQTNFSHTDRQGSKPLDNFFLFAMPTKRISKECEC